MSTFPERQVNNISCKVKIGVRMLCVYFTEILAGIQNRLTIDGHRFKGGSKNYHRKKLWLSENSVSASFGLFSIQSVSSLGHNARIAPFLT